VAKLQLVGDPAAVALLDDDPMVLLIGMLLDQPSTIAILITATLYVGFLLCCNVFSGHSAARPTSFPCQNIAEV
jgi:hypothetical protein